MEKPPFAFAEPPPAAFVPGMLIVRLEEAVGPASRAAGLKAAAGTASVSESGVAFALPESVRSPFKALEDQGFLQSATAIHARLGAGRSGPTAMATVQEAVMASMVDSENEDLQGITLLELKGMDALEAARMCERTPGIMYAHPVPARWLAENPAPSPVLPLAGADPLRNRQWALRSIRWFQANLPDAAAVKVGVLDTGFDAEHPEAPQDLVYLHEGTSADDLNGHGTHVAGIIAALTNNEIGVTGVTPCALHCWKIFSDTPAADGRFYVDEVKYQRALNHARNQGMQVLNLSISGTAHNPTEQMLFRRLTERNVVVVAAMGNDYQRGNPVEYPAAYPDVIAVGAVDELDLRASFSCTGPHICLAAPGVRILSVYPIKPSPFRMQTEYHSLDGTSMAAPHVTAAVALLLAKTPGLTPAQVRQRLVDTSRRVVAMGNQPWTADYGAGLLDLTAVLT